METYLTAVGIILFGALLQSSSYVPVSMVQEWSWESFSFVRGLVIYMFWPLWAASKLALPDGYLFYELFDEVPQFQLVSTIVLGVVWGAADLMYEKSMYYLGASRGKALSAAMTGLFGITLSVLVMRVFFYNSHPESGISVSVVLCMAITLAGYWFLGKAGDRKDMEVHSEQDEDRRQFDWKKGVGFAVLGGVMGACLNVAMITGDRIFLPETFAAYRWLPALFLFCIGAFAANTVICIVQNARNHSFSDYTLTEVWKMNLIVCAVTGSMEFAALFAFSVGHAIIKVTPLMIFAFVILLVGQYLFSLMWELIVNEWHGISRKTVRMMVMGILLLLAGILLPAFLKGF